MDKISCMIIMKFCPFKGNYIQVIKMFYYTFEYLLQ
jgi:hypothetical protein